MHAPTTRASTRARIHCFIVALSALVSPWVFGCAPSPPRVAHAFLHPSLDAARLAADGIAVYGFRGLDGTPVERRAYDRQLLTALRRSLPSARTLPPAKLQRWLTQVNKAEQFGAALDAAPGSLNYDQLEPLSTTSRYLLWGSVSLNETRQWDHRGDDDVDYCTFWQFRVLYNLVDLRSRTLVAKAHVDVEDDECRTNSRSNTTANADSVGGFFAGFLVDSVSDAIVDGIAGTYPDPPPTSVHIKNSADAFFRAVVRGSE